MRPPSKNIKIANNRLVQDERKAAYTIVQTEYTKDVPAIPLFNRTDTFAFAPDLVNFAADTWRLLYLQCGRVGETRQATPSCWLHAGTCFLVQTG